MALTPVPRFRIPAYHPTAQGNNTILGSLLIDAAAEKVALVFKADRTGNLSTIGFRNGSHTTNGDADVRLETVDATTGFPTGTLLAANTNALKSITAANTWWDTTLTAAGAVTRGVSYAAVIAVPAAGTLQTNISTIAQATWLAGFPYLAHFTTAWAMQGVAPMIAVGYDSGEYGWIAGSFPYSALTLTSFNTGSAADERGNRITLPYTCRTSGFYIYGGSANTGDVVLYDSDGTTVLDTVAIDPDVRSATAAGILYVPWNADIQLDAGETYRIVYKPSSGSSVNLWDFTVASAAIMTGAVDSGAEIYFTSRADAGSWTDVTTQRALLGLEIDQMDLGGGGGLIGPGGLRGGFQ